MLLATARAPALVVLAAMLGNVAVSTGETGPFLSIEQVLVARAAAGRDLTLRMSLYNLVGDVASGLGALTVAALPEASGEAAAPVSLLFWLFALSGGLQALLYARLPDSPCGRPRPAPGASPRAASSTASLPSSPSTRSPAASSSRASGLLALRALRARAGRHRRGVLRGPAAHGVLVPSRGLGLALVRAREHDGLLPPRLERPSGRHGARRRRRALAVALLLLRALLSQMDVPPARRS